MPPNWRAQVRSADDIIDGQWGEEVRFHPQSQPDEYTALGPDPIRPVYGPVIGVFERGAGKEVDTKGGQRIQADFTLSIQDRNLPPYELRDEDQIEFLAQDGMRLQITHTDPDATGRTTIYLVRV